MPRTNKRSKHLQQVRATKKAKLSQSSRSDDGDSSLPDLNVSTETDELSLDSKFLMNKLRNTRRHACPIDA